MVNNIWLNKNKHMKKIIVTITAALLFAFTHAADKVEKWIEHSFQSEFPGATHASWSKIENKDLYAVRFVFNNEARMAYFDVDGNYLAVVKGIPEEELPTQVRKEIAGIVNNSDITTFEEINRQGEISYLLQCRTKGQMKAYHVTKNGSIIEIKLREAVVSKK